MFIPDPDPNALTEAARKLNAELIDVVGGVMADLGGGEVDGGPVYAIVAHEPKAPAIMDWYLVDVDRRPLARVYVWDDGAAGSIRAIMASSPARKIRIRVERYTQDGDRDDPPSC